MENKKLYDERLKRIEDAIALKQPDRVPCIPFPQTYMYTRYGYTMAEVMYDTSKGKDAVRKFLKEYEPDMAVGYSGHFVGLGPALEKMGINWLQWAGRPGCNIDKNSIHQFIEKPYLGDDDYHEILTDLSGWVIKKYLPKAFSIMEPFANVDFKANLSYFAPGGMLQFINPQIAEAFKTMSEIGMMTAAYLGECGAFDKEMIEMGFPVQIASTTTCAFDQLSDILRGTIDTMADLYDQPENVLAAVEMFYPSSLFPAIAQAQHSPGKFVFIPLHKGLDGFMGNKQYGEFYWPTLKRLIEDLIKAGLTPWVYTEGKYDSRLEFLADIPEGKVVVHFEDVDMKEAKRIVGPHSCISGGFRSRILETGTVTQVEDEVKKLLDICAPGGGYIFDLSDTMDAAAKPENVEAMYRTVKECGKY